MGATSRLSAADRPRDAALGHGRRAYYGCFIDDHISAEVRDRVGVSQIMWDPTTPSSDTSWPNSRKELAKMLEDVPDHEALMMAELNAREVFRLED